MADSKSVSASGIFIFLIIILAAWMSGLLPESGSSLAGNGSATSTSRGPLFPLSKPVVVPVNPFGNSLAGYGGSARDSGERDPRLSPYAGSVRLGLGNIGSEIQPYRQYVVINVLSSAPSPVDIGGWRLRNNRDERMYTQYGQSFRGKAVEAVFPDKGVIYYNPYDPKSNKKSPLLFALGEKVIVTIGKMGNQSPVAISENFKENRCLGYIENLNGYNFIPSISGSCPDPRQFINMNILDDACYRLVNSLSRCREFEFDKDGCLGNQCNITSYCRGLIEENYNYETCFENNKRSADFLLPRWRVFLNFNGALFDYTGRRSVSLLDANGKIVDRIEY